MRKRSKISLILGAMVMAASIAVFAIIHPAASSAAILGFCFLLYAQAVFFGGFVLVDALSKKASPLLLWSGVGVCISIYAVIVFLASLLYMVTKSTHTQGFLVLQVILLIAAAVICLLIGSFSAAAKRRDSKTLQAGAALQHFSNQLALIREQVDNKAAIERLIEALRFSDSSATVDADAEIGYAIDALQQLVKTSPLDSGEFDKLVQTIESLTKKRGLQVKALKQGGI